jgi:rare lipoprotein A
MGLLRHQGTAALLAAVLLLGGCSTLRAPERQAAPVETPSPAAEAPPRVDRSPQAAPNAADGMGEEADRRSDVPAEQPVETGLASWYGKPFHGRRTANGERYDMHALTAAHKTMPLPSYARVRNPANGREVIVRVNDRGPFKPGRIIDLSFAAAQQLHISGIAPVEVTRLPPEDLPSGAATRPAKRRADTNSVAAAQ